MTWKSAPLGELLAEPLRNGRSARTSEDGLGVPVFTLTAVTRNDFSATNVKRSVMTEAEAEGAWAEPGDIFIQRSNAPDLVGTSALFQGPANFAVFPDLFIRVRPGDSLRPRFLLRFLQSDFTRRFFKANARGIAGSMPKISQGTIERLAVPVPPLDEQDRVVSAVEAQVSRLDAAVATLRRVKANLKRARASVLKAAVEGRLVRTEAALARAEGREYEPASALLGRILADRKAEWAASGARGKYAEPVGPDREALRELPEGWCWATVDSLLAGPLRNGKSAKASDDGAGIRTLTLTSVTTGCFSDENTKFTVATREQVEGLWLEPGDLLVQRSNTPDLVGSSALYRGHRGWAVYPDLLIRVRSTRRMEVEWLALALQGPTIRRYFRDRSRGIAGSMPKIDQGTIQATAIPLPPLPEQHRIVAEVDRRLSVLDAVSVTVDANLARCIRLRQSILKRAFEGRLVAPGTSNPPLLSPTIVDSHA